MTDDAPASVRRLSTKTPCSGVILITGASGRVARRTAGELERTSDTILRFTGTAPLTLEGYFRAFPELLRALHRTP